MTRNQEGEIVIPDRSHHGDDENKNQMQLMKNSTSAEMPKTLTEARNLAAATLANGLVHSVNILTSFGEVVVFRDGTIKLWEDCPDLH